MCLKCPKSSRPLWQLDTDNSTRETTRPTRQVDSRGVSWVELSVSSCHLGRDDLTPFEVYVYTLPNTNVVRSL